MPWVFILPGLLLLASSALQVGCLAKDRSSDGALARLQRPTEVEAWIRRGRFAALPEKTSERYSTPLVAHRFDAWAFTKTDPHSQRLGSVRAGAVLWAAPKSSRRGCTGGWYALEQGGYACSSGSFRVLDPAEGIGVEPSPELAPELDAALPYDYVRVATRGAPRYNRVPTPAAEARVRDGLDADAPLDMRMVGDYFLAVTGEIEDAGRRFYRTLRDKVVRAEDVAALAPTTLHGARQPALPLAFVIDADAAVLRLDAGELEPVGTAPRYARFQLREAIELDGARYAVGADGLAISLDSVRIASGRARPAEVGAREKWISVDLTQQTLVAYEGDAAVFATLVSSGKPGHDTPAGAYRIRHKHVSTTMRGSDPVDGPYEVAEVPWTMYYSGGYALHGAYWHDEFGRVRSHGCTNLAPADARWLLLWTDPPLPDGWHSIRRRTFEDGTRVYLTH